MATRWGIAGTGFICNDFVTAMKALGDDHRVVSVAARKLADAEVFAERYGVQRAYEGYHNLTTDPDVDIVYVGLISTQHYPVARMMLQAGKNVLCEKPMCLNVKQTSHLITLAREKNVFLMEGLWTRCFPMYEELRRRIKSGEIGDVVQVMTSIGYPVEHVQRISQLSLGGGGTLDIGIYDVQFTSFVMDAEEPITVQATGVLNEDGVDVVTSTSLLYSKGRVATLNSSIRCLLPNESIVVGTKGRLKLLHPSNSPEKMITPSGEFLSLIPDEGRKFNYPNSQGLMFEAKEVRRCLLAGEIESSKMPLSESLLIAKIMEQITTQVGVRYQVEY